MEQIKNLTSPEEASGKAMAIIAQCTAEKRPYVLIALSKENINDSEIVIGASGDVTIIYNIIAANVASAANLILRMQLQRLLEVKNAV